MLANSGLGNSNNSSSSSKNKNGATGSGGDGAHHRRRTMAHVPSSAAPNVQHDEVWGASSGHSTGTAGNRDSYGGADFGNSEYAPNMQQRPQYTPFVNEPLFQHYAYAADDSSSNAEQSDVPQRKARHQSLPANFSAAYQHESALQQHREAEYRKDNSSSLSGSDCLADVPRPSYAPASTVSMDNANTGVYSVASVSKSQLVGAGDSSANSKSVIDEELECVTANLNMML